MAQDISTIEVQGRNRGPEAVREFIPTPERVSQYLELKTEEVSTQMKSVDGRKDLYAKLLEHEEDLKKDHPQFDALAMKSRLDEMGETLSANDRYMKDIRSPEKQGLFRRAWETVKAFPRKHPIVTALLATAAVAGAVATGFYLAGSWELFMTSTGLSKIFGVAEAAEELAPLIPDTGPLPGAGTFDIPPPTSPPDIGMPL